MQFEIFTLKKLKLKYNLLSFYMEFTSHTPNESQYLVSSVLVVFEFSSIKF